MSLALTNTDGLGVRKPRDAKAYAKSTEHSFPAIERRRDALHISQADLCREAAFDAKAYSNIKKGRARPQRRTLIRLARALDRLIYRAPAPSPDMVNGFYRGACVLFARELNLDPAAVLGEAIKSRSNLNPHVAAAARCRRLAFYLTVNAYDVPRSVVARVIGYGKQAASKALREIEDRRDDPDFDALVRRAALLLTGGQLA
jgi:transcriptional regulator with XRE-family HTH domain